jgi:hypothetical protein
VQARRNRERRECPIEHVAVHVLAQQTALQDALGQFLDKQRHPIGAIDDLRDDLVGQRLAAGDLRCQSDPVAPVQPIERQHCHLRLPGPRRLELRTECHDQQHPQAADMLDEEVEQFARGRVNPMRVLEDHDHRLPARQAFELPDQCLECPFLLALGAKVRQRLVLRSRQRHEIDDECHILARRLGADQQGFELFQPGRRRVVAREPGRPAELVDERE